MYLAWPLSINRQLNYQTQDSHIRSPLRSLAVPTTKKATTTKKAPVVRKKRVPKKKSTPRKSTGIPAKTTSGKQPDVQTLTLDSVVVINNARALYEEFSKISSTDVNINASAVEMIDTAILQLLYAFFIKVNSSNHKVNWIDPSDEFKSRATLLGLSQNMGLS